MNHQQIETEYGKLVKKYENHPHAGTSIYDVLQYLLDRKDKIWHWSYEFGGKKTSTGGFLSHRACARASDLAIHHPDLVECRRIHKLMVYRLRVENLNLIKEFIKNK